MKKLALSSILFVLLFCVVVYASVSLNVTWQLSAESYRPGSTGTISLTLSNPETADITSAEITTSTGPYVSTLSGSKTTLGAISGLNSQTVSIPIKISEDAVSTVSYIRLEIDYYTGTSNYQKSIYIPVDIKREPILQIENVEYNGSTAPGNIVTLMFHLSNRGDGAAKDIIINLNQTGDKFITPSSAGEVVITSLSPGESKSIEFIITINPDTSVGIESIPINLEYYDESRSSKYTKEKTIGLTISGDVDFIINVESTMGETVTLSIANVGTDSAEYLNAKLVTDYGEKEVYVGSIDSDDQESVTFTLRNPPQEYNAKIILSYKDIFNRDYTVEKDLVITPTANISSMFYVVIFLIIIVAGVIYWYKRKRKK